MKDLVGLCHISHHSVPITTLQCREQLEEKSDNEQDEAVHAQRKGSIRRRLTLRLNRASTECGTKYEERSDIPGALLDIIVERISIALLQRPQGGCTLEHFPNTQDHHSNEVEEQS